MAIGLRDFWRGRSEFSIDLGYWRSSASATSDTARATYDALSWPAALRLIRLANFIPDPAEIEVLLDELYLEWYSSSSLMRRYPSFRYYLYRWLDYTTERTDLVGTWCARMDAKPEDELFEDEDYDPGKLAHHRYELARQGLLPTGGDGSFVVWMSQAERIILGEALVVQGERGK